LGVSVGTVSGFYMWQTLIDGLCRRFNVIFIKPPDCALELLAPVHVIFKVSAFFNHEFAKPSR